MRVKTNNQSSTQAHMKKKSSVKNVKAKTDKDNLKIIKCKHCLNPQTKTTVTFSCKHQLCGICISRLLIREDFKSLSDKNKIYLYCSICKLNESEKIGEVETTLEDLNKLLQETEVIRTEKKKDICTVHNKMAENYCIQCKKWLCIDCKNTFHNNYFKEHTLTEEEPFEYKICKEHNDKIMDLFCSDCQKEVCHFCSRSGEIHEDHTIITLNEYKSIILKAKRNYKLRNYDTFEEILTNCEKEFKKNFEQSFKIKQEITNEIINLLQKFEEEYFSKKQEKEKFIENYFKIIKLCYFNYFHDLKIKDPIINTLNFIKSVNKELLSINFQSEFTEDLGKIKENITKINPKKFFKYETKFLHHSLNCIKTINEESGNHIYCITQLKNGNIVTGGHGGYLNVWDLETLQKIDCFKAHEKNIYSVIQLTDGRLVSASGDLWIKFWDFQNVTQPEPKLFDIIDQNKLMEKLNQQNKKLKKKILKENDNEAIILRGPQKKNNINENKDNININNQNINENNITNVNNIQNEQNIINTNSNQMNFKNIIIPNNVDSNLNSNYQQQNAQDERYDSAMINKPLPQNISQGTSLQLNKPQDVAYSGNGNAYPLKQEPADAPYSGSDNMKVPDVAYSGDGNATNIQKVPNVAYGSSNVNINNNNLNINSNNNTGIGNQAQDVGYSGNGVSNPINNINLNINNTNFNNMNNNNINLNNMNNINFNNNIGIGNNNQDVSYSGGGIVNPVNNTNININNNMNNTNINESNNINNISEVKNEELHSKKFRESEIDFPEDEVPPPNPPKAPSEEKIKVADEKGNRCLMALRGHYDEVFCLLETYDKQLVSCSKDGTILIWSIDNQTVTHNFKGHNNSVGCVIEIGENKIATGGGDCKIKIWDISSNPKEDTILSGHTNTVFSICKINEKYIASASCDKTIRLWNLEEKKCECIFGGHMGYVWSVVKLKEDNRIASASSDRTIKIWDIDELKCINTIKGHKEDITVLSLLSDGKLVSGSTDMKIKIWEC